MRVRASAFVLVAALLGSSAALAQPAPQGKSDGYATAVKGMPAVPASQAVPANQAVPASQAVPAETTPGCGAGAAVDQDGLCTPMVGSTRGLSMSTQGPPGTPAKPAVPARSGQTPSIVDQGNGPH
jgi:hypothetical protein